MQGRYNVTFAAYFVIVVVAQTQGFQIMSYQICRYV